MTHDIDDAVVYIIKYLDIPKERYDYAESVIKGAYPLFDSMPALIEHVRDCIKADYGKSL